MSGELEHLRIAHTTRLGMLAVRREVKAGQLTIAQALADPRAQRLEIFRLLTSLPRWGRYRAVTLLDELRISELRRVGELTDRQRGVIIDRVTRPHHRKAA